MFSVWKQHVPAIVLACKIPFKDKSKLLFALVDTQFTMNAVNWQHIKATSYPLKWKQDKNKHLHTTKTGK